jgi:DNA-binding NarL/FixJ family response regulator
VIDVLIADDQDLIRLGLRTLIDAEDGLRVVGEAADGLAAVSLAHETHPHIVLMDVRMPGIDGIEATRRLAADPAMRETRVIVLTTFELDQYVFDALRHGASGFLTKDTKPADLLRAIRLVAAGEALLSPSVTRRVAPGSHTAAPSAAERPDRPGTGDRRPGRRGAEQRRDRRTARGQLGDRAYARQPGDGQARCTRPRSARRVRVPIRSGGPVTTFGRAAGYVRERSPNAARRPT